MRSFKYDHKISFDQLNVVKNDIKNDYQSTFMFLEQLHYLQFLQYFDLQGSFKRLFETQISFIFVARKINEHFLSIWSFGPNFSHNVTRVCCFLHFILSIFLSDTQTFRHIEWDGEGVDIFQKHIADLSI